MLKIGVLGVGHLGKIHVKCIQQTDCFELVGFFDPNDDNAAQVIENQGIKRFEKVEELLNVVDVVDIVTPTITHFELALDRKSACGGGLGRGTRTASLSLSARSGWRSASATRSADTRRSTGQCSTWAWRQTLSPTLCTRRLCPSVWRGTWSKVGCLSVRTCDRTHPRTLYTGHEAIPGLEERIHH